MRVAKTLAERLWAKVAITTPDACWEWTSAARTAKGYGVINRGRRGDGVTRAHRAAWEVTHGPIPDGLWVLHRCDNPPCCNPAHLYLGTKVENGRDVAKRRRARSAKVTHCPTGHRYSKANTRIDSRGRRRCRACLRDQRHEAYVRTGQ